MASVHQLKEWTEKYPFDEGELEIILRCHDAIVNPKKGEDTKGSFLNLLAHSFPYVFFFLPYDEIQNRISLVEKNILPKDFGEKLKRAIYTYKGRENDCEAIEVLIQGVANCCKGDAAETLGVIFDCCSAYDGMAEPKDIIKLCYELSISAQVLISPRIDEKKVLTLVQQPLHLHGLTNSLSNMKKTKGSRITKQMFIDWGTKCLPHIGSTLSGFMHNLVFHGKSSHSRTSPFLNPELLDCSKVFTENNAGNLFAISCMSPDLGGKWRRIFSSYENDSSTTSLEKSISQHVGSTIFVIKLDSDHIIGGVAESGWKFGYFLFEIEPFTRIYPSKGAATKFFLRHNVEQTTQNGEKITGTGFYADGGTIPDLFISDHLHWCKALFLDVPFSRKVEAFEVWGVEEIREGQSLKGTGLHKAEAGTHSDHHHPQ